MKKLLMLGTSRGSTDIVMRAQKKGIYTIVTDNYLPEESAAKRIADEYWMISTADVDILEQKCISESIDGILCGVSEFNLEIALELCDRLKLPFYCDKQAWHYSRDKADFKELCRKVNALVPEDYYVTKEFREEDLKKIKYPVMVKPIDQCANKGVA